MNEVLLDVPISLLRTLDTVPPSVSSKLPKDMSVHGLLAADLALDKSAMYSEWNAVVPTKKSVMTSLPLAWDLELQDCLPKPAKDLLRKQQTKLTRDWKIVHAAFPSILADDYMYAWLLVSTRSFYYTTPVTAKLSRHDRMVLQPVADLFNHADEGCPVSFDAQSFTILSDRAYAEGDEVFICYGSHSNDFLLTEYGFILADNRWDEAGLDDVILPLLSAQQKEHLEACDFLGNYKFDADAVCYRTQIALRILVMPLDEWRMVVDGLEGDEEQQREVDQLLVSLLPRLQRVAQNTISNIEKTAAGLDCQRQMLKDRWAQIQDLVSATMLRLEP